MSSPSVDAVSGHHIAVVTFLHTDIDLFLDSTRVRLPPFNDVGAIDCDIGVEIGRINPFPGEVVR